MTRRRLDAELVRRGLAVSRAAAKEAVEAGGRRGAGSVAARPATMVSSDVAIDLIGDDVRPFVSRAGGKLAAALDRFRVDPAGRTCLDAGASTGGFTDALLQRGARHVIAVDVGAMPHHEERLRHAVPRDARARLIREVFGRRDDHDLRDRRAALRHFEQRKIAVRGDRVQHTVGGQNRLRPLGKRNAREQHRHGKYKDSFHQAFQFTTEQRSTATRSCFTFLKSG